MPDRQSARAEGGKRHDRGKRGKRGKFTLDIMNTRVMCAVNSSENP